MTRGRWLWKSVFHPRARYLRIGTFMCLCAVLAWVSVELHYYHRLPELRSVAEFLAGAAAVFYSVDRAAGRLTRRRQEKGPDVHP